MAYPAPGFRYVTHVPHQLPALVTVKPKVAQGIMGRAVKRTDSSPASSGDCQRRDSCSAQAAHPSGKCIFFKNALYRESA
jgi:hypothetical protein